MARTVPRRELVPGGHGARGGAAAGGGGRGSAGGVGGGRAAAAGEGTPASMCAVAVSSAGGGVGGGVGSGVGGVGVACSGGGRSSCDEPLAGGIGGCAARRFSCSAV